MRQGKIKHDEGRSLVWVLSQVRAMHEAISLERLESRINDVAEKAGVTINARNQISSQPARLNH
jgi:hypothetical protein